LLRIHTILYIFILAFNNVYAIDDLTIAGGKSSGLGYTSVTQSDEWSAFNNQAGLAWCKNYSAGIYFENRFLLKDLSGKALAITLPLGKGAFGICLSQFGYSLFSEMKSGIAYGMHLTNRLSAGVQISYFRLHIADGFKDNGLFSCQIGLQFRASDHFWLGLHLNNPIPVKLSQVNTERLPTLIQFGFNWRISNGLRSDAEVEKDLNHKPAIRAGIEYCPSKSIFIRVGVQSSPAIFTFGFGFEFNNLQFDIASSYNLALGYSPQASVVYFFCKKKKASRN
jgi:hypothetical protein